MVRTFRQQVAAVAKKEAEERKKQNDWATLYLGDCMDILGAEEVAFDCMITDPPYFKTSSIMGPIPSMLKAQRTRGDLGTFIIFCRAFAERVMAGMKPDGHLYVFCDGRSYPHFYNGFYEVTRDMRSVVWVKPRPAMGHTWRRQHELILWGSAPKIEGEHVRQVHGSDGDVLEHKIVTAKKKLHPAEKPGDLLERLILKSTEPGEVVCDPFMGSGAVGAACQRTGRKFIGMDISEKYWKVASDRLGV